MTQNLVTAREIADLLGVSVETVWRYTRTGRIPAVRLSQRKYRYNPDEVAKAMSDITLPNGVREARPTYNKKRPFTYQDYLQLPEGDGYTYQILDGTLVKEPAPYVHHQRVSRRLQRSLEDYFAEVDPNGEVLNAPVDVTLSETNVVQPDLLYVPYHASDIVEERRINGPPHLVVEVVSPGSAAQDRVKKRGIYERMQVPHYWIVDYTPRTIECYGLEHGTYVLRGAAVGSEILEHPDFPGLHIDLSDLWQRPQR